MELPEPCDILDLLGNSAVNAHILLRPAALADSRVFVLTWVFFHLYHYNNSAAECLCGCLNKKISGLSG